jgi:AcrR family transcriptional regulator
MATDTPGTNETQRRILEAGIDLWGSQPPSVLFSGLTVASLSKGAGVTRSTFYAYWPSTEDYLNDLIDHLADREAAEGPAVDNRTLGELNTAGPNLVVRFLDGFQSRFAAAVADPVVRLRLGLLSKADDPATAERLRVMFRASEIRRGQTFKYLRDAWAREPRPPLDETQMQALFSVILDGLAARHIIDPEAVPAELYGLVVLSLLMILSRRVDDPRNMEDVLEAANNWPALGLAHVTQAKAEAEQHTSEALDAPRLRELVIATRRLATRVNWNELSMGEISLVTGASESTLLQAFGSKSGLAMAIFMLNASDRHEALEPYDRGIDELRAIIDINVDELRRSPALAQSVVMLVAGNSTSPLISLITWDPRIRLTAAVARAQEQGDLVADLDTGEFASVLGRVLLIDNTPPGSTSSPSIDAVELILAGAGAPPRTG